MDNQNTMQNDLASRIAAGLGEPEELKTFRQIIQRFPEAAVLRAYEEARNFPIEKIRKSKGAIFNYLVNKYARQHQRLENPRD